MEEIEKDDRERESPGHARFKTFHGTATVGPIGPSWGNEPKVHVHAQRRTIYQDSIKMTGCFLLRWQGINF